MDNMAQEALKRAQEMHRRRETPNNNPSYVPPKQQESERKKEEKPPPQKEEKQNPFSNIPFVGGDNSGILDILFKDKDRTIILILIILLYDEGNIQTIFALMYLLM